MAMLVAVHISIVPDIPRRWQRCDVGQSTKWWRQHHGQGSAQQKCSADSCHICGICCNSSRWQCCYVGQSTTWWRQHHGQGSAQECEADSCHPLRFCCTCQKIENLLPMYSPVLKAFRVGKIRKTKKKNIGSAKPSESVLIITTPLTIRHSSSCQLLIHPQVILMSVNH